MIVNENITKYLHSLETDNEPFLEELRIFAKEYDVPIIRREMESFLSVPWGPRDFPWGPT